MLPIAGLIKSVITTDDTDIMTKQIQFILILSFLLACGKKEESKHEIPDNPKPEELASIEAELPKNETKNPSVPTPTGFLNIKEALGDLDKDKEDELVIVYETNKDTDLGREREIHFFKKKNEKWELQYKSTGAVLASAAGGMMGDPFEDLTIEEGILVFKHFGGAREKWNYIHRFRFQNGKWTLIGATVGYGAPCDRFENFDYNLSNGKLEEVISTESCNENGEPNPKQPKDEKSTYTIKQSKPILMDGFTPGSNEVKLPKKDRSFYF